MWYHDTLCDFSIISDAHALIKDRKFALENKPSIIYEWVKDAPPVPRDLNPDRLTHLERRIRMVEKHVEILRKRFQEIVILDGYSHSTGLITDDEYEATKIWFDKVMEYLDTIVRKYRMFRMESELSNEEYSALYESITPYIQYAREMIRDRYTFQRELDNRARSLGISS